jgi:hypothetical protein
MRAGNGTGKGKTKMATSLCHHDPLVQQLIKAFGMPERTRSFVIRVAVDSLVEVECDFYPDKSAELISGRFRLERIEEQEEAAEDDPQIVDHLDDPGRGE